METHKQPTHPCEKEKKAYDTCIESYTSYRLPSANVCNVESILLTLCQKMDAIQQLGRVKQSK